MNGRHQAGVTNEDWNHEPGRAALPRRPMFRPVWRDKTSVWLSRFPIGGLELPKRRFAGSGGNGALRQQRPTGVALRWFGRQAHQVHLRLSAFISG